MLFFLVLYPVSFRRLYYFRFGNPSWAPTVKKTLQAGPYKTKTWE